MYITQKMFAGLTVVLTINYRVNIQLLMHEWEKRAHLDIAGAFSCIVPKRVSGINSKTN